MSARVEAEANPPRATSRSSHARARSDAPASQRPLPSRPRARTFDNFEDDDACEAEKRSSWISQNEAPVPAIPARFLARSGGSSHLHITPPKRASQRYNTAREQYKGQPQPQPQPASSPLAYTPPDPASASPDSPDRALPLPRRSLLFTPPRRHGVDAPPDLSPSTSAPRPANLNSPARHSRGTSLPTFVTGRHSSTRTTTDPTTADVLTGTTTADMGRAEAEGNQDLFMQLAEDNSDEEPTLPQRAASRSSWHDRRHQISSPSLPPTSENGRPRTSGQSAARPSSRVTTHVDTRRANDGYRKFGAGLASSFTSPRYDDGASGASHLRRASRYSNVPDYSPKSTNRYTTRAQSPGRSPELPTFGRRRPSFGYPSTASSYGNRQGSRSVKPTDSEGESPADSSEAKRSAPESDSVDSQTAPSTVWDELDDLKSRIKKLELTGKLPPTSSAAVTPGGASSERPRTATTAPTTVNSSPKQERKPSNETKAGSDHPKSPTPGPPSLADIHPTLHAALAKAKALLSVSLYRTLEATATDALQLAALTGSAGPQGTTFSAASIINGVTVSDRHIRRKADLMCRNLTDLCLALCEGKHEAPSIMSSPMATETPPKVLAPRSKYSRSSLALGEDLSKVGSRPLSRLEARRSSILGLQPNGSVSDSPHASADDRSASEHETTPSQPHRTTEARRHSRLSNRLSTPRFDRPHEVISDEDTTARPPSRAMTDIGNLRSYQNHQSPREYTTASSKVAHRSLSLRDSLNARRANASAHEANREMPRVASLNLDASRRRFGRESTPPVLEEETSEKDSRTPSRRRITSFSNQYGLRRTTELGPSRSTSLSQRRQNIVVE